MSDLIERLNAVEGSDEGTHWYRNPDGPEAAAEIERLTARIADLEAALRVAQIYVETDYDPTPERRGLDVAQIRAALGGDHG